MRSVLFQLTHLATEKDPRGMNAAALAREFGITQSQMARILAGDRYLHPGQIIRARPSLRDALLQAMLSCASDRPALSVEGEAFAVLGDPNNFEGEVARMLSDQKIDASERPKARQGAIKRIERLQAFVRAIDEADAKERAVTGNVVPMTAKAGT
ncbi:MAG TPA: hypothetical protein VLT45_16800 [Kofleriaceae bacterium]|nr:hypothetical protein [Kofleriaceae bacterium]